MAKAAGAVAKRRQRGAIPMGVKNITMGRLLEDERF